MARENGRTPTTARTGELRRAISARTSVWPRLIRTRAFVLSLVIWTAFTAIVGVAAVWARQQPMLAVDRIVDSTRTVRTQFEVEDSLATEQLRAAERQRAPRIYQEAAGVIDELINSIGGVPQALADVQKLEDIDPQLRERFKLTSDLVAAVKAELVDPAQKSAWLDHTLAFRRLLERNPFVDQQTYQVEVTAVNESVELRAEGREAVLVPSRNVRSIESQDLSHEVESLAASAGFRGAGLALVTQRTTQQPRATYVFDAAATTTSQNQRAAAVSPVMITYPDRSVIYRRGDVLTASQLETYLKAEQADRAASAWWVRRLGDLSVVGVVALVALAMAGYTSVFSPRLGRSGTRTAVLAMLSAAAAIVAWWTSATQPGVIALTSVAPTLLVAIVLAIAYDRRAALALGALHGVLVCIGLDAGAGVFAVLVTGVGSAMWCLREVRDRDTLIRTGLVSGLGLAGATALVGIMTIPLSTRAGAPDFAGAVEQALSDRAILQVARDAGFAGFAGPLVAAVVLFLLPSIERWFDITTGMTLAELRDPKNPLLRMLQQRAPGTYNHSLNLASLAEAAADAIGADSLLTYVGALYHDIGKMNKPDYFVENQSPGINKHDKLSPAMSLLIIVGHVKDGMELAREFNLPRPLWHFIESHHGTTLVEYFYHRARKQAEREALIAGLSPMDFSGSGGGGTVGAPGGPSEIEYRYPGPKPRIKEAAIIMLCDAVESASRAMADPTPARIDATVRAIANKRLMDGQFDDCDLTLRELNIIVEAVSKALASIYHGRIAYPTGPTARPQPPSTSAALPAGTLRAGSGDAINPATTPGVGVNAPAIPANGAGAASVASTRLPPGAVSPEQGAPRVSR